MYEEIRYPVCPYRNVPAAYQRFPGELAQRYDGTILIVRVRSKKAVSGAAQALGEFNAAVCSAWVCTVAACQAFALAAGGCLGLARDLLDRA